MEDIAEPSLVAEHMGKEDHAPELAARLRSFHDLPEGSLGRAYVDFCDRNNLTYPGDNPLQPAIFVAHDMTHVIAGYEPTGPGELALGAFQISMNDSEAHWIAFLGSIAIHEAGYFNENGFVGKESTLTRPGAVDTLTEAFARGQQCTGDFTAIDHLAMADRPLAEIRSEYNVVPVVRDR
jgi:ubiquinone biosynthesis protein Coq4